MDGLGPLVSLCLLEESQHDINIVDWDFNSKNKQAWAAVIGLVALIFYSRTIYIFANSFIKNLNPFIKNQLSIIGLVKNLLSKYVTDSLPPVFGWSILVI